MSRWEERRLKFEQSYEPLLRAICACSIGDMEGENRAECLKDLSTLRSKFEAALRASEREAIAEAALAKMSAAEQEIFRSWRDY